MTDDQSLSDKASTVAEAASTDDASQSSSRSSTDAGARRRVANLVPLIIFATAGILFFLLSSFWTAWENNSQIKTDDAYVRADVVPLSTRAHGIVMKTFVNDFEKVTAGQSLVELHNEDFKDRLLESELTASQAALKLADMKQRKSKQDAEIADAVAQLQNTKATVSQFDASIAIAKAAVLEAQANVSIGAANISQSKALVKSAIAESVKSEAARQREEALLALESSTKERVEQVIDNSEKASAALEGQNSSLAKANAEYTQKQAQLAKAKHQLESVVIDRQKALTSIKSREAEVLAKRIQRELLDGEEKQLLADLKSKKSMVNSSRIDLGYTTIKAPVAGTVGELKVKVGQFVNAGTNAITLISSKPWVIANFRETQISKITPGDVANVQVDAIAGKTWKARVESIAPASGAQFSLLPPDNASGNFTKITQRIPVKLTFEDEQSETDKLRPGMSVSVSITPSK